MAMLSDRTGDVVANTDQNADGRIDQRDDRMVAAKAGTVSADEATTTDSRAADTAGRAKVDEGLSARQRLQERTATATKAATTTIPVVDADEEVVVQGPRPRASLTATISLVLGVVAAVSVLTGLLAGPGVAVGLLAAIVGLGGVAATSRRHVAGKSDAFLGIALGLAAVVLGVLALTGNLSWLNGDTDMVARIHEWFAAHMSWLLP